MFVNIRADYSAHPIYYPACILALAMSFLTAYDIHVPPSTGPGPSSSAGAFGAVDMGALINRGIEAGGAGSGVLRFIRDAVDFVRRHAGVANPVLCATLVVVGLLGGEAGTVLLTGAPAFGKFVWCVLSVIKLTSCSSFLVVCVLVIVARRELKPLNVGELEKLKYNYKGA